MPEQTASTQKEPSRLCMKKLDEELNILSQDSNYKQA